MVSLSANNIGFLNNGNNQPEWMEAFVRMFVSTIQTTANVQGAVGNTVLVGKIRNCTHFKESVTVI